jgi:hypothetical protein
MSTKEGSFNREPRDISRLKQNVSSSLVAPPRTSWSSLKGKKLRSSKRKANWGPKLTSSFQLSFCRLLKNKSTSSWDSERRSKLRLTMCSKTWFKILETTMLRQSGLRWDAERKSTKKKFEKGSKLKKKPRNVAKIEQTYVNSFASQYCRIRLSPVLSDRHPWTNGAQRFRFWIFDKTKK